MSEKKVILPVEELSVLQEVDVLVAGGGPPALLRPFRRQELACEPC